mgnify:CR=1 FL=1
MKVKYDCYIVIAECKDINYHKQSFYGTSVWCKTSPSEITEKDLALLITHAVHELLFNYSMIDLNTLGIKVEKRTIEVEKPS